MCHHDFYQRLVLAGAVAGASLLGAGCHRGGTASNDPPGRVARLNDLGGDVSFQAPGANQWTKATDNYAVSSGDRLYVGPQSHAELDFGQGVARVGDRGDVTVTNLNDHFAQLGIADGTLDASIYHWIPSDSIELDTPSGALIPQAAGTYRVWVDPNDNSTIVSAESGTLLVTGPGISQTLQPGQTVRLSGTNPIQLSVVNGPSGYGAPEQFVTWSSGRDRLYRMAQLRPAARYVNQATPGWVDLVDNGRWITTPSNQEVWCPSNVSSSWVPYRTGHWTYVEPWGWTWVDDNSWGYTTTHYGRWTQVSSSADCSWGWVPSSTTVAPVYAPALVSFVEGIANLAGVSNPQGWFPLGPQEPYFPWYSHSDAYLNAVNLANIGATVALDRLLHPSNVDEIAYVNRPVALTVVPTTVVVSGEPVAPSVVHIPPGQLKKMGRVVVAPQIAASPRRGTIPSSAGGEVVAPTPSPSRGHGRGGGGGPPAQRPTPPMQRVVPSAPPPQPARPAPPQRGAQPKQGGRGSAGPPGQAKKPDKPGGGGGGGGAAGGGRGRGRPG